MVLSIALAAPIGKRKDVIGRQTLPPRRTENGRGAGAPRRTENGKRRTERAASARRVGRRENGQASKLGQTQRCAAITKNTKNHKDTQSTTQGNRRFWRTQRITEKTEDHRVGRSATARRTQKGKFGSLEAWKFGNAARLSQRTRRTTKDHKGDGTTRRRVVRARKAHVRPGGLRGMAGFARHALGERRQTLPPWRIENGACSGGAANLP